MRNSTPEPVATIYLITFTPNPHKVYIGKTITGVTRRWAGHCREARTRGGHSSMRIARAIAAHGPQAFEIRSLETCPVAEAGSAEIRWIQKYRTDGFDLYNLTDGGDGGPNGWHQSAETKLKISLANRGKTIPEDQRKRIAAALSGRKRPASVGMKVRLALSGRKQPEDTVTRRAQSLRLHCNSPEGQAQQRALAERRWSRDRQQGDNEMSGRLFGHLTVLRRGEKNARGQYRWCCRCSCGHEVEVFRSSLERGLKTTCGGKTCPASRVLRQAAYAKAWATRRS
ncbi:MAG: hypothetical protein A2Y38_02145 [Spirochaetes bacterium GWB1_59_5]|nr:MAG: hypothetical protein A2Y38_02145 [Spirochaetes bacterium GWB1_59_5]